MEKTFKQIEENFESKYSERIKILENKVENTRNSLSENSLILGNLNFELKNFQKENSEIKANLIEQKENLNIFKEKTNQINQNFENKIEEKLKNYKYKIN